jgi:hypothetical protein
MTHRADLMPSFDEAQAVGMEIVSLGFSPADTGRLRERLRTRHWTMLVVSVGVILLALALKVQGTERVAFRSFPEYPLPELCGAKLFFKQECPGCGLTRSFLALAQGDWQASLQFHSLGWLMALAVLLQIPYRVHRLWTLDRQTSPTRWPTWFGNGLIALLVMNWFAKILAG